MSWIYLIVAGIFESIWAIGLKYSMGFTKVIPSIFTILTMMISVFFVTAFNEKHFYKYSVFSLDWHRLRWSIILWDDLFW